MESTNTNSFSTKPLPVLALRNLVLFPGTTVPIRVGRAQSIAAIRALRNEKSDSDKSAQQLIAVLQIPQEQKEHISPDELHSTGVLVQIERVRGNEKDGFQLVVRGLERVRVRQVFESGGALRAIAEPVNGPRDVDAATEKTLLDSVKGVAKQILEFFPAGQDQMVTLVDGITDLDFMVNIVAANIEMSVEQKQDLLEDTSVRSRAMKLLDLMGQRRDELKL